MKIVILNLNSSYTFFKLLRSTSDTTEFSTVVNCGTIIAIELQNISWLHMETLYPFPPLHQLRSTTACILPLFPDCFVGFTDMESHSVAIHGWLLSLDTMFSKFIHVACISISFPFYHHVIFHCVDTPHFLYPFIRWWTFRSFPIFGYMNNFASIYKFCVDMSSIFLHYKHLEQRCWVRWWLNVLYKEWEMLNTLLHDSEFLYVFLSREAVTRQQKPLSPQWQLVLRLVGCLPGSSPVRCE